MTTVTDIEAKQLAKLHVAPAEDVSEKRTRMSLIVAGVLVVWGCVMPFLMINFYVKPFQTARGELMPDGSINWFAGEAILALSWFVVFVGLGWFATKVIRDGYSPVR